MKRLVPVLLTFLLGGAACLLPALEPPAAQPRYDDNLISTMVVQTAEALGTIYPAGAAPLPVIGEAETIITPMIGDAAMLAPAQLATQGYVIAELVTVTPTKRGCPVLNFAREAEMVELINAERINAGLNSLMANELLTSAAQAHSADMACNNYFSHFGLDKLTGGSRIARAGYPWIYFGENIAAGFLSPAVAVKAWMKSPSHRANILNKKFTEIGAGYAYFPDSRYAIYWTVTFGKR